jgi:hypothetical protein
MDFNPNSKLFKNMNILKAISELTEGRCKKRQCSERTEDQNKTIQDIAFKLANELAVKAQELAAKTEELAEKTEELAKKTEELNEFKLSVIAFVMDLEPGDQFLIKTQNADELELKNTNELEPKNTND